MKVCVNVRLPTSELKFLKVRPGWFRVLFEGLLWETLNPLLDMVSCDEGVGVGVGSFQFEMRFYALSPVSVSKAIFSARTYSRIICSVG